MSLCDEGSRRQRVEVRSIEALDGIFRRRLHPAPAFQPHRQPEVGLLRPSADPENGRLLSVPRVHEKEEDEEEKGEAEGAKEFQTAIKDRDRLQCQGHRQAKSEYDAHRQGHRIR